MSPSQNVPGTVERALMAMGAVILVFSGALLLAVRVDAMRPPEGNQDRVIEIAMAIWHSLPLMIVVALGTAYKVQRAPFFAALGASLATFALVWIIIRLVYG